MGFFSHSESVVCLLLWTNLTASLDALVVTLGHWHTSKFEAGGAPLPLARAGPALPALPISPWFLEVQSGQARPEASKLGVGGTSFKFGDWLAAHWHALCVQACWGMLSHAPAFPTLLG